MDDELDSDSDGTEAEPTVPQWQLFEQEVASKVAELDPASTVKHDAKIVGVLSSRPRQIDVLIHGQVGGEEIVVAVECKRYVRRLGIGAVDEFAGKLLDAGVDRGVLYALNGLTQPAIDRAAGSRTPRITLGDLRLEEDRIAPDVLRLFTGFGDCPNENCYTGDVSWSWWRAIDGSDRVRFGACDSCGTLAIECPECGEVDLADGPGCFGCDATIEVIWDRKGSDVHSIYITLAGEETTYEATGEHASGPADRQGPW